MASKLLSRHVMYFPNLRAAVKHFRAFSWFGDRGSNQTVGGYTAVSDSTTVLSENRLGPFGHQDSRFPLPGGVGTMRPSTVTEPALPIEDSELPEMLFQKNLRSENQETVMMQAEVTMEQMEREKTPPRPSPDELLECVAHECPQIMRKDFADLFPWLRAETGNLTVITVSRKTKHDMTGWSEDVEAEREQLLDTFIEGATEIREALRDAGYWADFIDPSSGRPYFGDYTNSTMYETDERYRKLGFEIDDLGCCKVIRHHIWGTHAYVGCMFTTAPTDHPVLQLMAKTPEEN